MSCARFCCVLSLRRTLNSYSLTGNNCITVWMKIPKKAQGQAPLDKIKKTVSPRTVSGMHFDGMEARHAAPHHYHVGTRVLVHPLDDLIVQVGVVKVILMNRQPPRMGQATHHCYSSYSIHGARLDLSKKERSAKRRTLLKVAESLL